MNRKEYMEELRLALAKVDKDLRDEILEDYEEHFENGTKYGKTEQQICIELGDIKELIKELGQFEQEITKQPQRNIEQKEEAVISNQSQSLPVRQIIVKALFADVNITRSHNTKIEVNCHHDGDRKQQMIYRFNSWQDGECIYAEVVQENSSTGFFNFLKTPQMLIDITVPENFPVLDVNSASGNIDVTGLKVDNTKLITSSGDIQINGVTGNHLVSKSQSGDVELQNCSINIIEVQSKSGDVDIRSIKSETLIGHSISGDVNINDINFQQIEINSTSGDLDGSNLIGNKLSANSKSGDINMNSTVKECVTKTISGDITWNAYGDINLFADSISGDIDISLNNHGNGYEATVQSVSGEEHLFFSNESHNFYKSGKYIFGNAGSKLAVKTTSGDIEIRG